MESKGVQMLTKDAGTRPGTVRVTFEFPAIVWAETVHLVGEFNAWDQRSLPLSRSRRDDPNWEITLELERGRAYQFRYLVNGTAWCNDCNPDGYVPNQYGGNNSIVQTG